ncbi:MAG: iron ABC transporter permease, partial [Syntrophaceae bacterium]
MRRIFSVWNLVLLLSFAIIVLAVVYPMFTIFRASFLSPETGDWSLESYRAILHYPFYRRCLENSLFVSVVSTALSMLIGVPFAFFLSRYEIPGKNVIRTLATLPLILPTFIGAEAWLLLAGRNGLFFNLFQKVGIEI